MSAALEHYSSQNLDHLGLVSGMWEELGLGELLDETIVQQTRDRYVTVGQAVKAMVLNGLGFANRALYLVPQFFADKPVDRLIGEGVKAEHLNDDALGRALDALYQADVTALYQQLAAQAAQRLGLGGGTGHLDITSFHVDGTYNRDTPPSEDSTVVHITPGYSRDHRPDLAQVTLAMIVEQQAGLPLWIKALNGNSNDSASFGQIVEQHVAQLTAVHRIDYWIADSALYSEANLEKLQARELHWITRVPNRLTLAEQALNAWEDSELLTEGYLYRTRTVTYGGVAQRWLILTSAARLQQAQKTVNGRLLKDSESELKRLQRFSQRIFGCEHDAQQALAEFTGSLHHLQITESSLEPIRRHRRRGRPAPETEAPIVGYRYQLTPAMDCDARWLQLRHDSSFILATNELDTQRLSEADILAKYKGQARVEHGFRFLKDPQFQAAQLYLKSPERISALLMIMTLSLLIYAALEYRLRKALAEQQQTVDNQHGKPIANPTIRWIFQCFTGIHLLLIGRQAVQILNLQQRHRQVLQLLGEAYVQIYS